MSASLAKLQRRLGYTFEDVNLLSQALTHRSHSTKNYERLELLGDSILNFIIAEELFHRFEVAREGQLSLLRAKMVRGKTLAEIARELELGEFLIMGSGELKSGGYQLESVLSDTFEAIIGAMYLDAGLEMVRSRITSWFDDRLDDLTLEKSFKDAKTKLQEFLQSKQAKLPVYEVVNTSGQSHKRTFYVECRSELFDEPVSGVGSSRRIAEQNAASVALTKLGQDHETG